MHCPVAAAQRNCTRQQSDGGKEREEAPRSIHVLVHRCAHAGESPLLQQVWEGVCLGLRPAAADRRPVSVSSVAQPSALAPSFRHAGRRLLRAEGGEKAPGVGRSGCSPVLHNRKSSVKVTNVEEPSKTTRPFLLFFLTGRSMCVSVRSVERPFLRRLLFFVDHPVHAREKL